MVGFSLYSIAREIGGRGRADEVRIMMRERVGRDRVEEKEN